MRTFLGLTLHALGATTVFGFLGYVAFLLLAWALPDAMLAPGPWSILLLAATVAFALLVARAARRWFRAWWHDVRAAVASVAGEGTEVGETPDVRR